MAVAVSYPGVYIQEVPSGSRAIAGVPTAVAAFVGYTARGAVNAPQQLFSYADFERNFGGLHLDSPLGYAVNHFFLNGGAVAWVVRVAAGAQASEIAMLDTLGTPTLTAIAASEGQWGNMLVLGVDYASGNPASEFNLSVIEFQDRNGRLIAARSEVHRNLSMDPLSGNYAPASVTAASDLISLRDENAGNTQLGEARSRPLLDAVTADLGDDVRRLAVSVDGGPFHEFDLLDAGEAALTDVAAIAARLQQRVRLLEPGNLAFTLFGCTADGVTNALVAEAGVNSLQSSVRFRRASIRSATSTLQLGLANGGREAHGSSPSRPAPTGTSGGRITDFSALVFADPEDLVVGLLDSAGNPTGTPETVVLNNSGLVPPVVAPTSLAGARTMIEAALRGSAQAALSGATVAVIDDALVLAPGGDDRSLRFTFSGAGATTLALGAGLENVAAYQMGSGPTVASQQGAVGGVDGTPPSPIEVLGSRALKSGMFALEDVDLFTMLNLPLIGDTSVLANAIAYAEERRSMILIDIDEGTQTLEDARAWINDPARAGLRHRNAAVYFPRVMMADPLQKNRARSFSNSGLMMGLYARTDAARGVWKAPAGIDARLRGVQALDYVLTDPENGVLNPLGFNCLRSFPVTGPVSWGARTMVGADALASEWKYVPVRRIALFIEESLYRGTQFVVFEPNDEPLWSQIRLSVGSFMNQLFRQGAFQGATPQEAYFVRCDKTTTTQADIDLGIVNIQVGFAPLKPAEFVIIQIQQMAGQSQA